ncbi:MAG TPA: hypothetical protein VGD78_16605 [Chthoniobacterales bacterium]
MPQPVVANYGATKVVNIEQAVSPAKALGGTGNAVSPGPIRTPGMEEGTRAMMEAHGQKYEFAEFEASSSFLS